MVPQAVDSERIPCSNGEFRVTSGEVVMERRKEDIGGSGGEGGGRAGKGGGGGSGEK
jgi:hypothetical protein